jgi:outer membrane protein OmpA-like peptidoglycan-associated protein
MKVQWRRWCWRQLLCFLLLASSGYVGKAGGFEVKNGHRAKVKGLIVARYGDLVRLRDPRASSFVVVEITDRTKIERTRKGFEFRHEDMDVTAMVPGLTVEVEGVGNPQGQLEAHKITFDPQEFATDGTKASQGTAANAAGAMGFVNTALNNTGAGDCTSCAGEQVNKRVSELDDYNSVAVAGIYFGAGKAVLDDAAKKTLDKLADIAIPLDGYLIEVAAYVPGTGSKQLDQSLNAERAEAVTLYLQSKKNIPVRRILAPAGYGSTHPEAVDTDHQGHALNRRVDVTVLVNAGRE